MTTLERAGHVTMPLTHESRVATSTLTVTGGVAGAAIGAWGGGVGAIPGGAAGSSIGGSIGKVIDEAVLVTSVRGAIVDGAPSVLVGEECQRAANADPTRNEAGCDNVPIVEGSLTVFVESWNFSRKEDRTRCGGKIADGCPTVHVGGEPSFKGVDIRDIPTWYDLGIDLGGQALGYMTTKGVVEKALSLTAMGATVTGHDAIADAANLTKGAGSLASGGSTLETIDNLGGAGHSTKGLWDSWFGN